MGVLAEKGKGLNAGVAFLGNTVKKFPRGVSCRKRLIIQKRTTVSCASFTRVGSVVRSSSRGCTGPQGLTSKALGLRSPTRMGTQRIEFRTFALIRLSRPVMS